MKLPKNNMQLQSMSCTKLMVTKMTVAACAIRWTHAELSRSPDERILESPYGPCAGCNIGLKNYQEQSALGHVATLENTSLTSVSYNQLTPSVRARIVEYAQRHQSFTAAEMIKALSGANEQTIRSVLSTLTKDNVLRKEGRGAFSYAETKKQGS